MDDVRRPQIQESDDVYLTPAQVRELANAMKETAASVSRAHLVGCSAGPRIGELSTLRWNDVTCSPNNQHQLEDGRSDGGRGHGGFDEDEGRTPAGNHPTTGCKGTRGPSNLLSKRTARIHGARVRLDQSQQLSTSRVGPSSAAGWPTPAPTFHDMRHTAVSLWIAAGAA